MEACQCGIVNDVRDPVKGRLREGCLKCLRKSHINECIGFPSVANILIMFLGVESSTCFLKNYSHIIPVLSNHVCQTLVALVALCRSLHWTMQQHVHLLWLRLSIQSCNASHR